MPFLELPVVFLPALERPFELLVAVAREELELLLPAFELPRVLLLRPAVVLFDPLEPPDDDPLLELLAFLLEEPDPRPLPEPLFFVFEVAMCVLFNCSHMKNTVQSFPDGVLD